jgi:hypothetical protein
MSKPPIFKSLLVVVTIATLCSTSPKAQAGEQNAMVVVGMPHDMVAISYPSPEYPADCQRMRIQGDVQVYIHVERGRMLQVTATSSSPLLAGISSRWVRRNWQFKPTVSGVYVLPIIYQLSA